MDTVGYCGFAWVVFAAAVRSYTVFAIIDHWIVRILFVFSIALFYELFLDFANSIFLQIRGNNMMSLNFLNPLIFPMVMLARQRINCKPIPLYIQQFNIGPTMRSDVAFQDSVIFVLG